LTGDGGLGELVGLFTPWFLALISIFFALERTIGSGVLYYNLEFDIFTGGLGVVGIYSSVATSSLV
jgi:hypothetical protein